MPGRGIRRSVLPLLAALALLVPLIWMWQHSRVPSSYSVMDMGYADFGGAAAAGHLNHGPHSATTPPAATRSVTDQVIDPDRPADVRVELLARQQRIRIGDRDLDGFTLNGATPGPEIRAVQGQLVEVVLRNASVIDGMTLHWHGVDVPNAMDGVAGVTQNAVPVGGEFVYRFVARRAGTFWYHSHQVSNPQVARGLFGALVITPQPAAASDLDVSALDVTALAHTYGGVRTINGAAGDLRIQGSPGQRARVRITNTDNVPMTVWASLPYRVLAVDGTDLHEPGLISDRSLSLAAGARADLGVTVPADGRMARIQLSKATSILLGPAAAGQLAAPPQPAEHLDLLSYGTAASTGVDPSRAARHFDYVIGRRLGFVRGRPGMWWSINGHLYPHVPMYVIAESDVVTMRLENRSSEVHPMHLHGHRLLVLARDDHPSTGSPWWVDSLDVQPRETYDVAFLADNPGIWMDHCHNLEHAEDGMVAHLMYEGFDTPFRIGGSAANTPE